MPTIPGFVDHHTHLLRTAAGIRPPYDWHDPAAISVWHRTVADRGSSPMDEPSGPVAADLLPGRLLAGLSRAARLGLVQVTEAGMDSWGYLDALLELRAAGPLPCAVRILVASGLADREPARMARTGDPWVEVVGVKLYADGWLGPRTCALCDPFTDRDGDAGVLFQDRDRLAARIEPLAAAGWTVATHAIGDRAAVAVLDAYEAVWGGDCHAAAPRIEHAQVLSAELIDRMASLGVVACIQPSFATTDAGTAPAALGPGRLPHAYAWDLLLAAGVPVITGSDYPIEDLDPLVGLRRLIAGSEISAPLSPPVALGLMTDAAAGTTTLSADPLGSATSAEPIEVERTDPTPG